MREFAALLLLVLGGHRQLQSVVEAADLLSIPSTTFKIPRNAQEGELIFGNGYIRASKDIDETLNLELEGTNPSPIAINGSIIDAGQPVKFVLVNKNAFENGKSRVKLQAIGVISGKVQEETINFEVESSSSLPSIPEIPNFVVKSDFQDKETAIVKVSGPIPPNSELEVLGSYAERVQATFQEDNIILDTVPCQADAPCEVTFPFTMILVLRNEENHVEALLTFEEEKKSSLKMTQKLYQTTIEEHTGEQDHLVKISTKGASSDEVLYSLRDSSGLFSIHPKEGILSILHPEFLTINSFGETVNLTVVATDGDKTTDAMIVVKIVPEVEKKNLVFGFEKDSYEITADNTNPVLGNIKAKSATPVVYRITEGRSDLYRVEPNGNLMYAGKFVKEDREDEITVVVQQSSGGLKMASTKVQIHLKGIGSNPITSKDALEQVELISSEEPEGVVVTSIQFDDADPDAKLQYSLEQLDAKDENGNPIADEGLFTMKEGEDKMAHLVVSGSLKDSEVSTMRLRITAEDSAHPKEPKITVTRFIVVQREKAEESPLGLNLIPMPKEILVPFDAPIGSFIYQATVLPRKNDLEFSIEPEHLLNISKSGKILTTKELTGEAESLKIHVTVKDSQGSSESQESLVTLRKATVPHFAESQYTVLLPRGTPEGAVLTVVAATNQKGEPVRSFLLKGGHAKYFSVDQNGAVKTLEPLDDLGNEFDLLVALADDPTVSVPIHVALQKTREPNIVLQENQVFATVFDNLPIGSFIGKVEVKNDEKVKFEMNSDEKGMMNLFAIGEDGTIRSKDWLAGSEGMHKFSVLASNMDQAGVRSANATVIIDVIKSNECAPTFKKDENLIFYVRENTPKDTVIGKVSADVLPGKCDLEYFIVSGNDEQSILSINPANGELKTAREFDFEKVKSHMLTLKLVAGKHNSIQMEAELRILDVDDHELKFDLPEQTVEVAEDAALGTVVATVVAKEEDESQEVWYHLKAGAPPEFSLDSRTGKVMVEQALDRERMDRYEIEIGASNSENPENSGPVTKVVVQVRDVNDNGPRFDLPHYFTVTAKDTVVGSALLELHAHDPDVMDEKKKLEYTVTGANFEYRGMSRNVEEIFDIQNRKLILMKTLMDYVGGVFNVQLQVRDTVDGTIGQAGLRVYAHDSSDILSLELPYSPSTVSQGVVQEFAEQVGNATGLQAIPKSVLYKAPHGLMSSNSVDLQMIFFNKTMSEIVPAERVLAIQEMKQAKNPDVLRNQPILRKPASPYLLTDTQRADTLIQPELFFLVLGFSVLLAIVLALCGMMACFARSKFLKEKRIVENEMAIKDAIQFPSNRSPALISFKHFAPPVSAEMYRNHEEHMYRSPNLNEKVGSYAVQQATITVAEHEEKI